MNREEIGWHVTYGTQLNFADKREIVVGEKIRFQKNPKPDKFYTQGLKGRFNLFVGRPSMCIQGMHSSPDVRSALWYFYSICSNDHEPSGVDLLWRVKTYGITQRGTHQTSESAYVDEYRTEYLKVKKVVGAERKALWCVPVSVLFLALYPQYKDSSIARGGVDCETNSERYDWKEMYKKPEEKILEVTMKHYVDKVKEDLLKDDIV